MVCGLTVAFAASESNAQTWQGGTNVWDVGSNWVGLSPPSSTSATARIATGSGGSIRFTDTASYTATVGTIDLLIPPSTYSQLNTGTGTSQSASINFGSGTAGINYNFSGTGNFASNRRFSIGANRSATR
ncbi:MAG TPA: hypothetical protein PLD59_14850 [Tepidisphaeraceae bacterium]|nr:hypothetical protein [Tepidisphaeraceae bacterium]